MRIDPSGRDGTTTGINRRVNDRHTQSRTPCFTIACIVRPIEWLEQAGHDSGPNTGSIVRDH